MAVHYKTYTASPTSETIARKLYGVQVNGDNTPGATTNSVDITVNGVDKLAVDLPPTLDSGVAGSPQTFWFGGNGMNFGNGINVQNFDLSISGTLSVVLLFEPA